MSLHESCNFDNYSNELTRSHQHDECATSSRSGIIHSSFQQRLVKATGGEDIFQCFHSDETWSDKRLKQAWSGIHPKRHVKDEDEKTGQLTGAILWINQLFWASHSRGNCWETSDVGRIVSGAAHNAQGCCSKVKAQEKHFLVQRFSDFSGLILLGKGTTAGWMFRSIEPLSLFLRLNFLLWGWKSMSSLPMPVEWHYLWPNPERNLLKYKKLFNK